jgi:hypothetical protein
MQSPYYYPAIITNAETGGFSWSQGVVATDPCANTNEISISFPSFTTSVTLFTIVVDAVPGETISLTSMSATVQSCSCSGNIPISSCLVNTNPFTVIFGSPQVCSGTSINFSPSYNGVLGNVIVAELKNAPVGETCSALDGVVHIAPSMSSINNIYFEGVTSTLATFDFKKQTNGDGSTDIYFKLVSSFPPTNPHTLFYIKVLGLYNSSQGGFLNTSLTNCRAKWNGASTTVCSPVGIVNPNPIPISGLTTSCPMPLLMASSSSTGGCEMGIEYRFKTSTPVTLSNVALQFFLDPNSTSNLLGTVTSSPNLSGGAVTMTGNNFRYELNISGSITISDGDFIRFPFSLKSDCISYFIQKAQGVQSGQSVACAMPVTFESPWPACNPEIPGTVRLSNGHTAPQMPDINLLSSNPVFNQLNTVICPEPYIAGVPLNNNASYSFCPDKNGAPYQLQMPSKTKNWLYGIDMLDVIRLSRHILNLDPLISPYQFAAANVVGSSAGGSVTTADIVELRKLILDVIQQFDVSKGYPSWRYFRTNYAFPTNPTYAHPYTGAIDQLNTTPAYVMSIPFIQAAGIANLVDVPANHQGSFGDFIAVKLGDVNLSGNCSTAGAFIGESQNRTVSSISITGNKSNTSRNEVIFHFKKENTLPWLAAQFGIGFNSTQMRLKQIIPNQEIGIEKNCFGETHVEDGIIRFGWVSQDAETPVTQTSDLFDLVFEIIQPTGFEFSNSPVSLSDEILEGFAFELDGTSYPMQATYMSTNSSNQNASFRLVMQPNPASESTKLVIFSDENAEIGFQVTDAQGKICVVSKITVKKGENIFDFDTKELPNGIYHLCGKHDGSIPTNYTFSVIH